MPIFRRREPRDSGAFAAEVLTYLEPLFAAALRLTRNRADAEDLVQDTLLKAFRFEDRFTSGTNLRAWLYTILHNTWRNQRRDAARNTVDVDSEIVEQAASLPGGPAALETPERILMRDTLDADLQAALDALPEAFREAVWLRDVEEFSYAEIARVLDVPVGTVMSRISRGRRMLFDRLRKPAGTKDTTDTTVTRDAKDASVTNDAAGDTTIAGTGGLVKMRTAYE